MTAPDAPLHSPAFARLLAAYRQRGLSQGEHGPIVGYVGNTVPVELIVACGALPLRIAPMQGPTEAAEPYVEAFADPDARRIFARFVEGALDHLALLVIPRSSETWHKLYLALREAQRIGLKAGGPPLVLYELLHTQRPSSHAYGLARTRDLAARLAQATGQAADAAGLRAAIAQGNGTRRLLQGLQTRRGQGQVNGWRAQVATGALRFMAPDDGQDALRDWLNELDQEQLAARPVPGGAAPPGAVASPARLRLYVQGVPLDHAELHAAALAAGADIVIEDDDWGSRAAAPLIDDSIDPLTALFEHCSRDVPCLRIHPPPPGPPAFIAAHRAGLIDGLLFHLPRPDDVHGWLFPAQRAAADASGIPWLLLRDDAREAGNLATDMAKTQAAVAPPLQAFVQQLRRLPRPAQAPTAPA